MNTPIKLRYVWLDNVGNVRNKLKVVYTEESALPNYNEELRTYIDEWNFDGSSTNQAKTENSDLILNPKRYYPYSSVLDNEVLVICEVEDLDKQPICGEYRHNLEELSNLYVMHDWTFGLEQEYFMFDKDGIRPYRWPSNGYPEDQGRYYCGSGVDEAWGEEVVRQHVDACLEVGISLCGTNAEVAPAQWEFQVGPTKLDGNFKTEYPLKVADDLIAARYLLYRVAAKHGISIKLMPKLPETFNSNWNGSGLHTNFSNIAMRTDPKAIQYSLKNLEVTHKQCMKLYGDGNSRRLVGSYETSSYNKFTHGESHRECSIRIPIETQKNGFGYLEDRRPAANANPYAVLAAIMQSVEEGECNL